MSSSSKITSSTQTLKTEQEFQDWQQMESIQLMQQQQATPHTYGEEEQGLGDTNITKLDWVLADIFEEGDKLFMRFRPIISSEIRSQWQEYLITFARVRIHLLCLREIPLTHGSGKALIDQIALKLTKIVKEYDDMYLSFRPQVRPCGRTDMEKHLWKVKMLQEHLLLL